MLMLCIFVGFTLRRYVVYVVVFQCANRLKVFLRAYGLVEVKIRRISSSKYCGCGRTASEWVFVFIPGLDWTYWKIAELFGYCNYNIKTYTLLMLLISCPLIQVFSIHIGIGVCISARYLAQAKSEAQLVNVLFLLGGSITKYQSRHCSITSTNNQRPSTTALHPIQHQILPTGGSQPVIQSINQERSKQKQQQSSWTFGPSHTRRLWSSLSTKMQETMCVTLLRSAHCREDGG